MKLFRQLLVAPAALGLMAPLAANAAELNINDVSDYASGSEVQNFSDVYPTDWAFKALTSLAERHGCSVATPTGSITRYEAASLLNKCLGNVAQVNEEERRLINEFAPEIAVIKGRIDGLEARVGEFEAGQFSNTTKLTGKAAFIVGGVDDATSGTNETNSMTMQNMYTLNMNTSFSVEDLLYARIKTGNVRDHFGDKGNGTYLSAAGGNKYLETSTTTSYDILKVDKIWYQFPIGDNVKAWVGPKIENYYMLASAPSIYKPVLKQFSLGGNGTVYGSSTQPGLGLAWTQSVDDPSAARFAVSAAYTAQNGEESGNDKGLFGADAKSALLTKVEYGSPRWQVSLAAAFKNDGWEDSYFTTRYGKLRKSDSSETAIGLRGYWKPEDTGFIPAVQVGVDLSSIDGHTTADCQNGTGNCATETQGWMVGAMWKDAIWDGNTAGVAFGQRVHATSFVSGSVTGEDPAADGASWEAYYSFKVSDNVSVTPAVFGNDQPYTGDDYNNGYVILTEFRF